MNKIFNKKCAKARRRSLFSVSSASKKLTIFGKSIYFVKRKHES